MWPPAYLETCLRAPPESAYYLSIVIFVRMVSLEEPEGGPGVLMRSSRVRSLQLVVLDAGVPASRQDLTAGLITLEINLRDSTNLVDRMTKQFNIQVETMASDH